MPYDIRKSPDGKYHVFNQTTGEEQGVVATRAKAETQMRLLYAKDAPPQKSPGMRAAGGKVPSYLDDTYTPRPIEEVWVGGTRVEVKPE